MSVALGAHGVRAVVLDIEGTITPVSFMYDVLFPYARAHMRTYLRATATGDDAHIDAVVDRMTALMDADRKEPELKELQGKIWDAGYASGELRGDVFPDVPPALERWAAAGHAIAIYSSGSVLAQRLLLGHTAYGDLTRFISRFFDTHVGAKQAADSYRRISGEIGGAPRDVLFISDVTAELDAARAAGLNTLLCVRPGNAEQPPTTAATITTFDEIAA